MTAKISQQFKHPLLQVFAKRFGEAHVDLACHAAFPVALTPELLYSLRENFLPDTPWIAVADILLFLCDSVGYQLYELQGEVRNELLLYLKDKQRFGVERLYALSDFMVAYIRQQLKTNNYADEDLGATPHWTALAYIKPQTAVNDIAENLQAALQHKSGELVKFTSLLESYADTDPLMNLGFKHLLGLSRGWDAKVRGDTETAEAEFAQLRQEFGDSLTVGGVRFEIPPDGDDELLSFDFEVVIVNRRGEIIQRETKQAKYFIEDLGDGITLEMVAIPGGKFMMGSPNGEGDYDEHPQHEVNVQPFFMGKYPITQAQWRAVAALPQVERDLKPNPSCFKGDDLPVECASWYDVTEFCKRLSKSTGQQYRLPSEAEWEYACRAKTVTHFYFGETITGKLANYDANYSYANGPKGQYRETTTSVGTFPPNAFGLYDMHGNVWEWCADNLHNYKKTPNDGSTWSIKLINDNHYRVVRGGSWKNSNGSCRSAYRCSYNPDINSYIIGFRVVSQGAAARTR
ncbi:hypothetical protein NIES4103_15780 [Nostoc sp. NIES-4103]|nr:hypothetical protein NIES4103_15780 [Nostoc sp. NIES-4103]